MAAVSYHYEAGSYQVGTSADLLLELYLPVFATGTATRSMVAELEIADDAVIREATFAITAEPGGYVPLESLGQVRAGASSKEVIVDLGGMTTLGSVSVDGMTSLSRWNGVNFVSASGGEIQTERLQLTFAAAVSPGSVGSNGRAHLPSIPTSLELLVDGTTVWFERQGSTADVPVPAAGDGVAYAIDRTDAIRDAFARTGGPVRVELRALTPGDLTLSPSVLFSRVHHVAFPEGPSRSVVKDAEGLLVLELPLPDSSASWTVDAVDLVVSASPSKERIVPADGPTATADARLRLPPGRMVLARIPDALRTSASTLSGLRIAVRGAPEGGEVAGRLLADSTESEGRPGLPVDGGELTPAAVDPVDEARWVTLRAAAPVTSEARWVELGASYGTVEWELTSVPSTDEATPGAELHLRKAGGAVRALPVVADIGPVYGTTRAVVEPDVNRPIGALTLGFLGQPGSNLPFTPAPDGVPVHLLAEDSVQPVNGVVSLAGVVAAPATYTFADVRVTYREGTS